MAEAMLPSGVVSLEVDIIGPGGVKTTHHHPLSILVNDDVQPEASSSRYAKLSALSGSQQQIYSNLVDEQKLERVLQFIRIWASSECNKASFRFYSHPPES